MIRIIISISLLLLAATAKPQSGTDTSFLQHQKFYHQQNGDSFYYKKPGHFSFISNIPKNSYGYFRQSLQKENLYKVGIVAASTTLLLIFDQRITDGVQGFAKRNSISANEQFEPIVSVKVMGKKTNLGKWPKNFNTAVYNLGQGSSVVLVAAGFFIGGKIKHDNRALQTASQLAESFLALGVQTQVLKYATGRENPSDASVAGGRWHPFPSFSNFQNNKPKYDAFPSGHLATFVSAVTIVAENYPAVRWIKPVGYTIASLLSFAMINNGVHWASDFPLGFALGYGYGKYITHKNKITIARTAW